MHRMLIAVDVDGTLFDGVTVAPEAADALRRAKADGHTLVIVSGRRWASLPTVVPGMLDLFDRVVCEEGGVLVNPSAGTVRLLAPAVEPQLVRALRDAGVTALDVGDVVIGAPSEQIAEVGAARDSIGSARVLVTNKGSVALVPPGCDKGTGLLAAIADLGLSGVEVLAIGDAANDLPMFAIASIAVGVANADAAVRASGVELTHGAAGAGVAEALRRHLPRQGPDQT